MRRYTLACMSRIFLSVCLSAGVAAMPLVLDTKTSIKLPPGFKADIFADHLSSVRHITVGANDTVYAHLAVLQHKHGKKIAVYALKDSNSDGVADQKHGFGRIAGTGIAYAMVDGKPWLYVADSTAVYRYALGQNGLPKGHVQTILSGLDDSGGHASKSISLDHQGHLYVSIGAPSNACMKSRRTKGSPGQMPCPELKRRGGIWTFPANKLRQTQRHGEHYATGIRNIVAMTWSKKRHGLYAVQHGRDQLAQFYPQYFSRQQSAELPAEEFHRINQHSNLGWPYTYWDHIKKARMVMPEYDGDGQTRSQHRAYQKPLFAFPGHWAPNGLIIYEAKQFPQKYQGAAFVAFHGSWNRSPVQQGYHVAVIPVDRTGKFLDRYEIFADGFIGHQAIQSPGQAQYRPMGLAVDSKGALYISDSVKGRIWKVSYQGASTKKP